MGKILSLKYCTASGNDNWKENPPKKIANIFCWDRVWDIRKLIIPLASWTSLVGGSARA